MKILICDDRDPNEIEAAVLAGASNPPTIDKLSPEALADLIKSFFARDADGGVQNFLKAKSDKRSAGQIASDFDEYDLIILDNNLGELNFDGLPLTAEAIAGFIRGFSKVPYVISLNKNPSVDFDLKYVVGDFDTKADIALNTDHLEVPGLWGGDNGGGERFHPSYWPNLAEVSARRREQVAFVLDNLDQPILGTLQFPVSARAALDSRSVGFLSSAAAQPGNSSIEGAKPLARITFWNHFQNSGRSLPFDYRAAIALPNSTSANRADRFRKLTKAPEDDTAREIIARVVAAELDYWFRRDVLATQDLLVDAAHLKLRFGLLPDGAEGGDSSVSATTAPFGLPADVFEVLVEGHRFAAELWVGRPCFWWNDIERQKDLKRVRLERGTDEVWVFCEDTRRFLKRSDSVAFPFVPDGGKPWAPLFVEVVQGRNYMPISQFAA